MKKVLYLCIIKSQEAMTVARFVKTIFFNYFNFTKMTNLTQAQQELLATFSKNTQTAFEKAVCAVRNATKFNGTIYSKNTSKKDEVGISVYADGEEFFIVKTNKVYAQEIIDLFNAELYDIIAVAKKATKEKEDKQRILQEEKEYEKNYPKVLNSQAVHTITNALGLTKEMFIPSTETLKKIEGMFDIVTYSMETPHRGIATFQVAHYDGEAVAGHLSTEKGCLHKSTFNSPEEIVAMVAQFVKK